ncbi:hypothetical protein T07_12292 [Trichinella nelsoni]|uniref:CX domain-containing protein n=1 Tax=Trichinella nelsoni TaxID=6336 RepID=A0A0V0S0W3_9BILA|nr:hypothetical protein T07_12292 [Trichinella nelsoni]
MFVKLLPVIILCLFSTTVLQVEMFRLKRWQDTGDYGISDRLNRSSVRILRHLLLKFNDGPFPRKVAQYNSRQPFPRYNRDYWIGERYYFLDPTSLLMDRMKCSYPIPEDINVFYEDNERVNEIVFQCFKYQEICCGEMDCCLVDENGHVRPRFPDNFE